MISVTHYLSTLQERGAESWNRFWFAPASPRPLALLRIGTGVLTLWYLLSWCSSLTRWFTAEGLLPPEIVQSILRENNPHHFHYSPLFYLSTPTALWSFHALATFAAVLFTLGVCSRFTGLLTLLAMLSYVHRAPMLISPFESLLVMLLCYLPLGPCGAMCSFDAWRTQASVITPSWTANLSLRLIQLHLCGFILLVACSMMSSATWWNGTAIWLLEAQTSSRPLNLSSLRNVPLLVNAWTHAFVLINVLFPVLVWNRLLRPLVLLVATFFWLLMIPLTGQLLYIFAIVIAFTAFGEQEADCAEEKSESA